MKEWEVLNYSFLRSPAFQTLIVLPAIGGSLIFYLGSTFFEGTEFTWSELDQRWSTLVTDYLSLSKFASVIVLSFFLAYRWTVFKTDGSYGYWLSQGIKRRKYLIFAIISFFVLIFCSQLIGIVGIFTFGGFYVELSSFLQVLLLIIVTSLFVVVSGILIAEVSRDSEVTLLIYLGLFFGLLAIQQGLPDILQWVFFPERFIFEAEYWPIIGVNFVINLVIIVVIYLLHMRSDIEL